MGDLTFWRIYEDIDDLYNVIESEEITIDEIVSILAVDEFFDPSDDSANTQFENMVASFSPYCFMMIVQYNSKTEKTLRERIKNAAITLGVSGEEEYYFISPQ